MRDAQELLSEIVKNKQFSAKATFCITKVKSENEGIVFFTEKNPEGVYIPTLRQQQEKETTPSHSYLNNKYLRYLLII